MNNRVLVTYATKAGSTAEVAARIGEILSTQDLAVDVLPVSNVDDVTPYRAVIAGSAIRVGHLLPEVMSFVKKNQAALQQRPFSVFVVCMTMTKEDAESRKTASAYLDRCAHWSNQ
jgi:menaquinone-dependent protoporphyrinogen oxidase